MDHRKTSRTTALAVGRWLLLLLVAWPGPRPIVHSHDQLVQRRAALDFGAHLSLFHSAPSRHVPPSQLHVHWTFGECCSANERLTTVDQATSATTLVDNFCDACLPAIDDGCFEQPSGMLSADRLSLDDRASTTPTGRHWLQLCGAWTC